MPEEGPNPPKKKRHDAWNLPGWIALRDSRNVIVKAHCQYCDGKFSQRSQDFMKNHRYENVKGLT